MKCISEGQQTGLGERAAEEGWFWGEKMWEKTDYGMAFIRAADQDGKNVRLELLFDPWFPKGSVPAVLVT